MMDMNKVGSVVRCLGYSLGSMVLCLAFLTSASAQPEQRVEVRIQDFTFKTTQTPLQLHAQTLIVIRNEDAERHDFGSEIFQGTLTRVESNGVFTYGHDIDGVYIDPGKMATIRFVIERPGRYEFKCSIHPNMKGEILLMSVGAV